MANKKTHPPRSAIVASFLHHGRAYEQRMVNCGKANCTRCNPSPDVSTPSHGPYWYLCGRRGRRWRRVYLGKELDTERYVDQNDHIDWVAISNRRARNTPGEGTTTDHPGQTDMVDDVAVSAAQGAPPPCTTPTDISP